MWMVRAGKSGVYAEEYREEGIVAIGWNEMDEVPDDVTREQLATLYDAAYPDVSTGTRNASLGQLVRFRWELNIGDSLATYDSATRRYLLGTIESEVYHRDRVDQYHARRATWNAHVARDALSARAKNSLGSSLTLFRIPDDIAKELRDKATPISEPLARSTAPPPASPTNGDDEDSLASVLQKSEELIEDRLVRLDWAEMQELVAGVLRAMGYKTRVSPTGADRGKDIFASPDGLGLEEPRIFVEVKHRPGTQMGAPEVRRFLGGRSPGDKCLFVSTGSFTKEAVYEAERSAIPLTLIRLPELRELVLEHYERMDSSARRLVPLERLYWPARV